MGIGALDIFVLVFSLFMILVSCELFTNGIECLGQKISAGDGVIGSIFSAVGTCLPETVITLVAILFPSNNKKATDIGIGAIVGAPFMLGTLAFFLAGLSVIVFKNNRRSGAKLCINRTIVERDLAFFIVSYIAGMTAFLFTYDVSRKIIAFFLILLYVYYVILTVTNDGRSSSVPGFLYMKRYAGIKRNRTAIPLQLLVSLAGLILSAALFVESITYLSRRAGVSPMVLSLLITPIATELPEKFNSIIWIRRSKDTLALGNITGAMVFQSCIPVAIGIVATPWQLDIRALASGIIAILSTAVVLTYLKARGRLSPFPLMMGGILYAFYILFLKIQGIK